MTPGTLREGLPAVLSRERFCREVGISKSMFFALARAGRGPRRIALSARRFGIRSEDAVAWIESRTEHGSGRRGVDAHYTNATGVLDELPPDYASQIDRLLDDQP